MFRKQPLSIFTLLILILTIFLSPFTPQSFAQQSPVPKTVTYRLRIPVASNATIVTETNSTNPAQAGTNSTNSTSLLLKDYLASTRVIINDKGEIGETPRYYPYGSTPVIANPDERGEAISNNTEIASSSDESGTPRNDILTDNRQLTTAIDAVDPTTDRLFTGHRKVDDLNIYHAGARFYSPQLGIFIQPDTAEGPNRFAYVGGNPVMGNDPSGHQGRCEFCADRTPLPDPGQQLFGDFWNQRDRNQTLPYEAVAFMGSLLKFTPVGGALLSAFENIMGEDLYGNPLSTQQAIFNSIGILGISGVIGRAASVGRLGMVDDVARDVLPYRSYGDIGRLESLAIKAQHKAALAKGAVTGEVNLYRGVRGDPYGQVAGGLRGLENTDSVSSLDLFAQNNPRLGRELVNLIDQGLITNSDAESFILTFDTHSSTHISTSTSRQVAVAYAGSGGKVIQYSARMQDVIDVDPGFRRTRQVLGLADSVSVRSRMRGLFRAYNQEVGVRGGLAPENYKNVFSVR